MSGIPRMRRWLSAPTPSADMCHAGGWLSFRRLIDLPFDAGLAAVESWQRTGQDIEPDVRHSLLRGPIEADRHSGTCRIQIRWPAGRCARRCS